MRTVGRFNNVTFSNFYNKRLFICVYIYMYVCKIKLLYSGILDLLNFSSMVFICLIIIISGRSYEIINEFP